jgi:hypothetical protein
MSANAIDLACLSVAGGWQCVDNVTGITFGPIFNKIDDLWEWQKQNPVEGMKLVRNLMSQEYILIAEDTPWCCNPASETYWSM